MNCIVSDRDLSPEAGSARREAHYEKEDVGMPSRRAGSIPTGITRAPARRGLAGEPGVSPRSLAASYHLALERSLTGAVKG
jgi:hypothetical protein